MKTQLLGKILLIPLLLVEIAAVGVGLSSPAQSSSLMNSQGTLIAGKTLALVGSDVALEGGYLTAPAGRIELGSISGPTLVSLTPTNQGWALGYEGVQNFRDIRLSQSAIVYAYTTSEGTSDIQVQGRRITLSDGSFIANVTGGASSAGLLNVNASESVELIGTVPTAEGPQLPSSLRTDTLSAGNAGNLRITTPKLILQDGARVSVGTTTGSTGQGGTLTVTAASVELSGTSADGKLASGLLARTGGTGLAGNLMITTGQLIVRDKAQVNVGSTGSGNAGNLKVKAGSINLDNKGAIIADTASGEGGNITLQTQNLRLRGNSSITTNAGGSGNGGNIKLDTSNLVALEKSDITANAVEGKGGNIQISTQGLFLSPDSQITASSDRGINGTVQINTLGIYPSRRLVNLPLEVVDISGLIAQGCPASVGPQASKFVVTGRGGLPPNLREALNSEPTLVDLGTSVPDKSNHAMAAVSSHSTSTEPNQIVEAQGWVINSKGQVVLTAQAPTFTPRSPWLTSTACHAP